MSEMNSSNDTFCLVFPMGIEAAPFLHCVEVKRRRQIGRATYREALFEGRSVLIVRSGIGPVRAAEAIRALEIRPAAILSVGTAGSLVQDLEVGHFVVASETVANSVGFGKNSISPGVVKNPLVPPLGPPVHGGIRGGKRGSDGILPPESICEISDTYFGSGSEAEHLIECAPALVTAAIGACRAERRNYKIGRIVTVKDAVVSREDRNRLHRLTAACAVDMESHAVAEEALKLRIPFAALRVISDDLHSPDLPDPTNLKRMVRNPRRLPRELAAFFRWRVFFRDFRRVTKLLSPVLVRLLRSRGQCFDG